jgi:hypothetical protein
MRKEIKEYYETNFGSFASLLASEIEKLCLLESGLWELSGRISYKEKTPGLSSFEKRKYLRAKIEEAFTVLQN